MHGLNFASPSSCAIGTRCPICRLRTEGPRGPRGRGRARVRPALPNDGEEHTHGGGVRDPAIIRGIGGTGARARPRREPTAGRWSGHGRRRRAAPGSRQPVSDPLLGQAVRVTSGALARSLLAGLTSGEGATALGRTRTPSAARTPTRYARRARAGPTPFGLFAGSAEPGWFGGPGGARRR
ncbi:MULTISPECIES: lantibiotic dehydratase [unclassified Streptomyces]|uniref:lantibiotic dehydratase n=1 Tax=unclassified Streptomyces TaxID=2593676 RepID=UPI002349DE64|nr:lantibiotic dehydratase [Streptomyces sp. M92]WCN05297.1 lantibiotic dehydratase [Streptomyces sp. M92]